MEVIDPTGVKLTIGSYPGRKGHRHASRSGSPSARAAIKRRAARKSAGSTTIPRKYCPQKGY